MKKNMTKKGCYIDEKGYFKWDDDIMAKWFSNAMKEIERTEPEMEQIPYMVFLMGCEAALRLEEVDTLH